jgi:hypothetical protein
LVIVDFSGGGDANEDVARAAVPQCAASSVEQGFRDRTIRGKTRLPAGDVAL